MKGSEGLRLRHCPSLMLLDSTLPVNLLLVTLLRDDDTTYTKIQLFIMPYYTLLNSVCDNCNDKRFPGCYISERDDECIGNYLSESCSQTD